MKLLSTIKSKYLKSIKKTAVRGIALIALVASFVLPMSVNNSYAEGLATPRFNFLQGDSEMLMAANATKSQAAWADPVAGQYSASIGDEVVFRFYFHNGMLNSTAHNTILRALLPNGVGTKLNVLSHLSSDETTAISDTVVDGHIVGYGNGLSEINLATPGRLEYVPNSTKIWRSNPNEWGVTLRDGITSNDGINIGSINGCWDFAGYVTFKAVVKSPAQITIDKYVAYPGTSSWSTILEDAKEGETVAWKVPVKNTGDTDALNVLVKDTLPSKLTYIAGSTVYFGPDAPANGFQMPDGISGNGLYVNSLKPGSSNVVYFVFQTRIGTGLTYGPNGVSELVNWASAIYNGQEVKDQAKVTVIGTSGLTIQKTVWNGSNWVEVNNIHLGDHIKYRVILSNVGQINLTHLKLSDVIPVYSDYIVGSTRINGVVGPNGIEITGLDLGTLSKGCSISVEFEVKTSGCPPIGDYTLVNTAYGSSDQVMNVSDTASTIMSLQSITSPGVNNM